MRSRSVLTVESFAREAPLLRQVFDERFEEPRSTRSDRFVWDWWHVPGQYTALRTPAWTYFPKDIYEAFHRRLVAWGRATLGCHDVSPPWLSCYVDGCRQDFHGDLPHGPFAFVYSLTNWSKRTFRGGETLMLRDEVLDYWQDFRSEQSIEEPDLIREIEPKFGRLTVFDPRIPHGVREVTGTRDPRQGRLVIHGWFVQPRPFIEGPLRAKALSDRTEDLGSVLGTTTLALAGMIAFAFDVDRGGGAQNVRVLSDTTRVPSADERERLRLVARLKKAIAAWQFGAQRGTSRVTLPIVLERQ